MDPTVPHEGSSQIRICERCCTPIADHERFVSLAHIACARPGGAIEWRYAYLHTAVSASAVDRPTRCDVNGARRIS